MTTLEQARRRALALGAELEVDGRKINAGRQRLSVVPKTADAPTPAGPAKRDKLDVLVELATLQMQAQAQHSALMGKALTAFAGRFEPPPAPPPEIIEVPQKRLQPIAFRVLRDASGKATGLDPRYGDVGDGIMSDLREVTDERGLLEEIRPVYN